MTVFGHDGRRFFVAFADYDPLTQLKTPSLPHSPQNYHVSDRHIPNHLGVAGFPRQAVSYMSDRYSEMNTCR
jgi:hypothetical protein